MKEHEAEVALEDEAAGALRPEDYDDILVPYRWRAAAPRLLSTCLTQAAACAVGLLAAQRNIQVVG